MYLNNETHYFCLTPTKESLLQKGVFKNNYEENTKSMENQNIDMPSLELYTRDAVNFCTNNVMSDKNFVKNSGIDDLIMVNMSPRYQAVNASRVFEMNGKKLLLGLIGDSLVEVYLISV